MDFSCCRSGADNRQSSRWRGFSRQCEKHEEKEKKRRKEEEEKTPDMLQCYSGDWHPSPGAIYHGTLSLSNPLPSGGSSSWARCSSVPLFLGITEEIPSPRARPGGGAFPEETKSTTVGRKYPTPGHASQAISIMKPGQAQAHPLPTII